MNFSDLDRLIHSNIKRISLTHDVVLEDGEELVYKNGIGIDLDGLIIDGMGHTVGALGKTGIFHCTGKNITLKNGNAFDGGQYSDEGELTIIEYTLTKNTSRRDGGAIYN